jgi:hypothetical protein
LPTRRTRDAVADVERQPISNELASARSSHASMRRGDARAAPGIPLREIIQTTAKE